MGSTPVGYLYTPQQLAGSVRYGNKSLLGNWREDNELHDMRMMDYIAAKESNSLMLLKKQGTLGPQLAPAQLSTAPADGIMRFGDRVLVKSQCNDGALAVSLGQKLACEDADLFGVFCTPSSEAMARNAIKFSRCAEPRASHHSLVHAMYPCVHTPEPKSEDAVPVLACCCHRRRHCRV